MSDVFLCGIRGCLSLFFFICPEPNPDFGVEELAPWRRGAMALEDQLFILVVEGNEEIQTIVEDALAEGGFEPAVAPSGEEAVTLLRGHRGKYRALVADIVLRGRIDGWEVAQRAREIDPDFPVIYMTGVKADQWRSRGVPNSVLMEKPFAPAQLVTAVSQLLNGGPPAS